MWYREIQLSYLRYRDVGVRSRVCVWQCMRMKVTYSLFRRVESCRVRKWRGTCSLKQTYRNTLLLLLSLHMFRYKWLFTNHSPSLCARRGEETTWFGKSNPVPGAIVLPQPALVMFFEFCARRHNNFSVSIPPSLSLPSCWLVLLCSSVMWLPISCALFSFVCVKKLPFITLLCRSWERNPSFSSQNSGLLKVYIVLFYSSLLFNQLKHINVYIHIFLWKIRVKGERNGSPDLL